MMEFTAEMIAGLLEGEVVGDKEAKVNTVSSIEEGHEGSLAYLTNLKYEPYLYTTGASIVLTDRSFVPSQPVRATLVKVESAAAAGILSIAYGEADGDAASHYQRAFDEAVDAIAHLDLPPASFRPCYLTGA